MLNVKLFSVFFKTGIYSVLIYLFSRVSLVLEMREGDKDGKNKSNNVNYQIINHCFYENLNPLQLYSFSIN